MKWSNQLSCVMNIYLRAFWKGLAGAASSLVVGVLLVCMQLHDFETMTFEFQFLNNFFGFVLYLLILVGFSIYLVIKLLSLRKSFQVGFYLRQLGVSSFIEILGTMIAVFTCFLMLCLLESLLYIGAHTYAASITEDPQSIIVLSDSFHYASYTSFFLPITLTGWIELLLTLLFTSTTIVFFGQGTSYLRTAKVCVLFVVTSFLTIFGAALLPISSTYLLYMNGNQGEGDLALLQMMYEATLTLFHYNLHLYLFLIWIIGMPLYHVRQVKKKRI